MKFSLYLSISAVLFILFINKSLAQIDPQIDPDDFRISFNGPNGNLEFDASRPALAYNSIDSQYLAVWASDDIIGGMVNDELEVFGQLINLDGSHDTTAFRISFMAGTGNAAFDGELADVAYNPLENNFLVIWRGDNMVDDEFEVWGQFVDANGQLEGSSFQISNIGTGGDNSINPTEPRITYNSIDNEYLVVWSGFITAGESEIYGKFVDAQGNLLSSDTRFSEQGPFGNTDFGAELPAVVHNTQDNEYLLVWQGDDNAGSLVDGEFEIYGQLINDSGTFIGSDFRISDMGADGQVQFDALEADLTYNSIDNEYLVVWRGDDGIEDDMQIYVQRLDALGSEMQAESRISDMAGNTGNPNVEPAEAPSVDYDNMNNRYLVIWDGDDLVSNGNQPEIFGQFLTASAQETTPDDFRISTMNDNVGARFTEVRTNDLVFNPSNGEFMAVWAGEDTGTNEEFEIFGQRLKQNSPEDQFRLSDMGGTGDFNFDARDSKVAYNAADNQYLVVWEGDDNTNGLINSEFEIFGQLQTADGIEIGSDFRISEMGGTGDAGFDARDPQVAYNSLANEYLVVWEGDDNTGGLVDGEFEIFGQLLAADGTEIGSDFRISDMGGTGNANFGAFDPQVAYNVANNQYLVVWEGDDNTNGLVNNEREIFGQRLDAQGIEIGTNDFRISDMGGTGDSDFNAFDTHVAYNAVNNQYLVVWEGDDNVGGLVENENEIFGQRLSANGIEIGSNDFRISDMGGNDSLAFEAFDPSVVYNSIENEYLVVWGGDDNVGGLVENENEIFGQRLRADGTEIGENDFRISDAGPNGDINFEAAEPHVSFNSTANNYLVVWHADDNRNGLVSSEFEIFGQFLLADGMETGENDFRVSEMAGTGDSDFDAFDPQLAYNAVDNQYLVVWEGEDDINGLVDGELEIYGELIAVDPPGPCPAQLTDVDIASPILSDSYEASQLIISRGLIEVNSNVIFDAGGNIELKAGFEVELGADFEVILDGCD